MLTDNHKGFTIVYNHLNLPVTFTKGTNVITITYAADGTKLTKTVTGGTTKNYVSGIEYAGINVEAIYHAEGRLTPNGSNFYYEYSLKDHLGNARVNFRANGTAITHLEAMDYYPFGMLMEGMGATSPSNDYAYNGKELNEDFGLGWYDYGARWYDPSVGRWSVVDPLADHPNQVDRAPYAYAWNNPIYLTDPDGRCPSCFFRGVWRGVKNTVTGIADVVMHPIETVKSLGHSVSHPIETSQAIGEAVSERIEEAQTTEGGEAELAGEIVFELATVVITATKISKISALSKLEKIDDVADATKSRVYLRKGTREKIKNNAPKTSDGDFIDPNTGQIIPKDRPFHYGHKPGQEWHRRKKMHQEKGSTRKEVRDVENNPDLYQIEDPTGNLSHKYEKKGN